MTTIDMQTMRYLNLLDRTSRVKTSRCFIYNDTVIFVVNRRDVSRAIGRAAVHVLTLQQQIGKKIKIIGEVEGVNDIRRFIEDVIVPRSVKTVSIDENVLTITAGNIQTKAMLIGRDKRRYDELRKIVQEYLGLDLKIV